MKSIDTLVEDIYHILSANNDHEPSEANVEAAGELFKDVLRTRFKARKPGGSVLRFSSLGKPARQLWYAQHAPEAQEEMPPSTYMKFLFGDILEILLLFLAKEAGHEVTHEQFEVEVDGVKGHTDAIIDGVPVDVKSASSYSFEKFKSGGLAFDDPFGYIAQLGGYAHALNKTDEAAFLVVDKTLGHVCLSVMDEVTIRGAKPEVRIKALRDALASPEPPQRCYDPVPEGKSGNMKLATGCSYCSFKKKCWADANGGRGLRTFLYARGPVFLTEVAKEPNVPEGT